MASSAESSDLSNDNMNLVGAFIFWMYNVSALYLLYAIILILVSLQRRSAELGQSHYKSPLVLAYLIFSVVSFSTLSYNMLNVLIQSFHEWYQRSLTDLSQSFFADLWLWSIQSSLFTEFAQQITASPQRWFWSQSELGLSMMTSYWMAIEARHANAGGPIPKLWAFFALLQILPTSIVLNLFLLARLLAPKTISSKANGPEKAQSTFNIPYLWISVGITYFLCLFQASTLRYKGDNLIRLVLFARLLLVIPFLLKPEYIDAKESKVMSSLERLGIMGVCGIVAAASAIYQGVYALRNSRSQPSVASWLEALWLVWSAKDEHPGVASLAYDAMQCIISASVWSLHESITPKSPSRKVPQTYVGRNS